MSVLASDASPEPPIVCETLEPRCRYRVLQNLMRQFDGGARDPELLYLGGRYAASLGLQDQTCRFLDELTELLRDGDRIPEAFFPVGLLYLRVLPRDNEKRKKIEGYLSTLAADSPRLRAALEVESNGPSRMLEDLQKDPGSAARLINGATPGSRGNDRAGAAVATAEKSAICASNEAYRSGKLSVARMNLESLLLANGNQPDVLRNLLLVTAEQEDIDAYRRYWRRYVKLNLWRLMYGADAWAAEDELTRFYVLVAKKTELVFGAEGVKQAEVLRRPGLLPAWLEAHAALVWLSCAFQSTRPHQTRLGAEKLAAGRLGRLAVMKFWFAAFYPEFLAYVDLGEASNRGRNAQGLRQCARRFAFDPEEKLLTRFAQWSLEGFGLSHEKTANREEMLAIEAHQQAVEALVNVVARIPWQPYVKTIQKTLNRDDLKPKPFRDTMQEACTRVIEQRFAELWKAKDWTAISAGFCDPDLLRALNPMFRTHLAYALCKAGKETEALGLALQTLPELRDDDIREKRENEEREPAGRETWMEVLFLNIEAILKLQPEQQSAAIARLRAQVREGARHPRVVKEFEKQLEAKNYSAAGRTLDELPDRESLKDFRTGMRRHLTVAEVRERINQDDYSGAKSIAKALPRDMKEFKDDVLKQIEREERKTNSVARIRELLDEGNFDAARRVIRDLPKTEDYAEFGNNLLKQIELKERTVNAVARIQACVDRFDYAGAKRVIRDLPETEFADFSNNMLKQIAEAEGRYREAEAENAFLRNALLPYRIDINRTARDNNLDTSNPFAMNQLLKFLRDKYAPFAQMPKTPFGDNSSVIDELLARNDPFTRRFGGKEPE
jgi:hypothetical protein